MTTEVSIPRSISKIQDGDTGIKSCRLVHHGAAATVSGNQIVTWIPAEHAVHNNSSAATIDGSSSSILVYASNAILNIAESTALKTGNGVSSKDDNELQLPSSSSSSHTRLRHVQKTLRCTTLEKSPPSVSISPIVITCVVTAKDAPCSATHITPSTALVSGFSNGMIQVWLYHHQNRVWMEHTIVAPTTNLTSPSSNDDPFRSVTAIDAIWLAPPPSCSDENSSTSTLVTLQIAAGTSAGMTWYECTFHHPSTTNDDSIELGVTTITRLSTKACGAVASLHYSYTVLPQQRGQQTQQDSQLQNDSTVLLLFIGTAAPKHNKIHVYQCSCSHQSIDTRSDSKVMDQVQYCGFLVGHEDWVTTLSSCGNNDVNSSHFLLASGSQDARIRIWKFRTSVVVDLSTLVATTDCTMDNRGTSTTSETENGDTYLEIDENDGGNADDEFYDDVGESRLEILHKLTHQQHDRNIYTVAITSVTLEALLCGHEEGVTSVAWHPNPKSLYGVDQLLISSSTDRTILLWSETPVDEMATNSNYGGIWTPLTRVGSAGGILGGSIGSTLLGFCGIAIEPKYGRTIVGHAYGGALHVWDVPGSVHHQSTTTDNTGTQWKASPCITGHFAGITDCSWEAANGDYLLTVSNDQTCRLWAQLKTHVLVDASNKSAWLELARPQVHGYNLSAVASLSTRSHPHLIVTGADEKEIRAFDAPKTTLRLLDTFSDVAPIQNRDAIHIERVERAYIPSLGLSNKASPADAAAEDDENDPESKTTSAQMIVRLPLERDLGAVSLWPENQKLFGHNTEIYCLAATSIKQCGGGGGDAADDLAIVASSAKARDAEDAKIRLWNVITGQCIQVLSGGHRSTVATLHFSANGEYLASSGKDRRLCLWKKQSTTLNFVLAWAMDSAHRRIVWSVHFCPFESQMLASASRDGCIKIWSIQEDATTLEPTTLVAEIVNFSPSFERGGKPDAVTAISFAPIPLSNQAVIAVGLESGRIELWCVPYEKSLGLVYKGTPYLLSGLDPSMCHCDTVTKLAWRPIRATADSDVVQNTDVAVEKHKTTATVLFLASCSMDHGCRIFEIEFPKTDGPLK